MLYPLVYLFIVIPFVVFATADEEWIKALSNQKIDESIIADVQIMQNHATQITSGALALSGQMHYPLVQMNKNKKTYIFISLSIPIKNIKALLIEAKNYNATLVLRGLKENSYIKTASYLQKLIEETGMGVIIDPGLFSKYQINAVPSFVMAKGERLCPSNMSCMSGKYDKLVGNVTLGFALEKFKKEGEAW